MSEPAYGRPFGPATQASPQGRFAQGDDAPQTQNLGSLLAASRGKAAELCRRVEAMLAAVEGQRSPEKETNGVGRPDSMRGTADDTYSELCKLETALERLSRALGV